MLKQILVYILDETQANIEDSLYAIPEEFIVPTHLVLNEESFEKVIHSIKNPPEPTEALIDLMREND